MKTFQDYLTAINTHSEYLDLIGIFIKMGDAKESGELSNWDWWNLYNVISPKLTRAFKQTETGKQMMKVMEQSPRAILANVEQEAMTSIR